MFIPKLEILPPEQKKLWSLLYSTPDHFILYGGTAIALRLAHRTSVDFDFFSKESFIPDQLYKNITYLKNAEIIQKAQNTLTCLVPIQNTVVKVSFFGGIDLKQINPPSLIAENKIRIASLLDLFGMKCSTICTRIEAKDYLDIYAIISQGNLPLYQGLAAAQAIYEKQYQPLMTLKALACFEGGDLKNLDTQTKKNLTEKVKEISLEKIPTIITKKYLGEN